MRASDHVIRTDFGGDCCKKPAPKREQRACRHGTADCFNECDENPLWQEEPLCGCDGTGEDNEDDDGDGCANCFDTCAGIDGTEFGCCEPGRIPTVSSWGCCGFSPARCTLEIDGGT